MKRTTSRVVPPLLALAVGACGTEPPTAVVPPAAVEARAPVLSVSGERLDALRVALGDAESRLLPTLEAVQGQQRLALALAAANGALQANDARMLAGALVRARAALADIRGSLQEGDAVAPEVDALLLMLDGLDEAVPQSLTAAAATPSVQ